jgi:Lrp/AsnC family transcriptional regulator for asnA, asnC and gidA
MEDKIGIESLDLKDKKILFELDFNARMPYSVLGKKVGLSKHGVEYRIQNLIKRGIINGFYPVINVPLMGFLYCRLTLTLQNITREKRKEINDYLLQHKKVFWLLDMQGIFDLGIVIWADSVSDFKDFIEELESKYGEFIKKKNETIATDVIHFQHRYLLGIEKTEEIHLAETVKRINLDYLDKKILSFLSKDARISFVDIASEVGESAKVVAYRIKKMEENKIILGYRPIINHTILGYTYYKLFLHLNRISKETLHQLKNYIKNNFAVIYFVEGIGLPADLDIEMMIQSNQKLFQFMEDLRFKFPNLIGEYQTVIFLDTLKVKYLPFEL